MTENEIATIVVDACFRIHKELGAGLFESVYEEILCYELIQKEFLLERQKGIAVQWKGVNIDLGFRADIIVDDKVILELKSVETIAPVHKKQLLTYLKLTGLKLGLLVNFNEALIKNGITRIVNKL